MFQTNFVDKIKTDILCSKIFFFRNSCRLWDNVGKQGRARQVTDDDIVGRWRFACWITKATNTHSKYVILIGFPRRKWLCERTSILRYTCIDSWLRSQSFVNIRGPLYKGFSTFLVQPTCYKGKGYPATGRRGSRGSGYVKAPDFLDVRHYKVGRSSAIHTGRLYPRRNPWY
jgi:hypothetical protein